MQKQILFKNVLLPLLLLSTPLAYADSKPALAPQEETQNTPAAPEPAQPAPTVTPQQGPAPLPSSEEMTTSYEGAFVRMIVTLLGIVFLVFATFWILRRLSGGKLKMGTGRTINIIEKRALSPKSMLYIVEIGNKKVLISESQYEVRTLTTYEEKEETNE